MARSTFEDFSGSILGLIVIALFLLLALIGKRRLCPIGLAYF